MLHTYYVGIQISTKYSFFVKPTVPFLSSIALSTLGVAISKAQQVFPPRKTDDVRIFFHDGTFPSSSPAISLRLSGTCPLRDSHIIPPLSILTTNVTSNGSGNPRLNEFKAEDDERTRGRHDERAARREATQQPAGTRRRESGGVGGRREGGATRGNATTSR